MGGSRKPQRSARSTGGKEGTMRRMLLPTALLLFTGSGWSMDITACCTRSPYLHR